MKNLDIYGSEHRNNLTKLKYNIVRVIYILAFITIFSSKFSNLFKISEESIFSKISFYLSILFGLLYLFLDRRLKKIEIKLSELKNELEFKESFYKIFMQVLSVESSYRFETRDIGKLHEELQTPFSANDLEAYIVKWKKIGSIFTYKIANENPESDSSFLLLPIMSIQDIARFLGAREFSRQIITYGLKHNMIAVKSESVSGGILTVIYDINPTYKIDSLRAGNLPSTVSTSQGEDFSPTK